MNLQEALSAAVDGERVRAVDMPEGVFVDYHFNGWRINFPSGSSSGWNARPHDETVEWEIVQPQPVRDKWGRIGGQPAPVVTSRDFGKWGRQT